MPTDAWCSAGWSSLDAEVQLCAASPIAAGVRVLRKSRRTLRSSARESPANSLILDVGSNGAAAHIER
jgi:hypothetical protein